MEGGTLERLARRMTVAYVLGFVQQGELPPAMHQPKYVIAVGPLQSVSECCAVGPIRLVTWGFVGGPVSGEHPDRKHTPFCVRIESQVPVVLLRFRV